MLKEKIYLSYAKLIGFLSFLTQIFIVKAISSLVDEFFSFLAVALIVSFEIIGILIAKKLKLSPKVIKLFLLTFPLQVATAVWLYPSVCIVKSLYKQFLFIAPFMPTFILSGLVMLNFKIFIEETKGSFLAFLCYFFISKKIGLWGILFLASIVAIISTFHKPHKKNPVFKIFTTIGITLIILISPLLSAKLWLHKLNLTKSQSRIAICTNDMVKAENTIYINGKPINCAIKPLEYNILNSKISSIDPIEKLTIAVPPNKLKAFETLGFKTKNIYNANKVYKRYPVTSLETLGLLFKKDVLFSFYGDIIELKKLKKYLDINIPSFSLPPLTFEKHFDLKTLVKFLVNYANSSIIDIGVNPLKFKHAIKILLYVIAASFTLFLLIHYLNDAVTLIKLFLISFTGFSLQIISTLISSLLFKSFPLQLAAATSMAFCGIIMKYSKRQSWLLNSIILTTTIVSPIHLIVLFTYSKLSYIMEKLEKSMGSANTPNSKTPISTIAVPLICDLFGIVVAALILNLLRI